MYTIDFTHSYETYSKYSQLIENLYAYLQVLNL